MSCKFLLTGIFCFIVGSRAMHYEGRHRTFFDVDTARLGLEDAEVSLMKANYRHWAANNAEVIHKAAERMSRVYSAREPARKDVVHLHLHNSAGSLMCSVAHWNGENVNDGPDNCNLVDWQTTFNDGPHTRVKQFNNSCSNRQSAMQKQGVTLSMIERWVDVKNGDWCPDDFIYTVIMRDPLARTRSTLRLNEWGNQERVLKWLREPMTEMRDGWLHSHAAYSDLVVRILNGPDAMVLPLGALNETHLQRAKDMLQAFDAVLAIPTLGADYFQLVEVLHWKPEPNPFLAEPEPHPFETEETAAHKHDKLDPELEELLERHNEWDTKLYNFALELAKTRTDAAVRRIFSRRSAQ